MSVTFSVGPLRLVVWAVKVADVPAAAEPVPADNVTW